MKPSVRVYRALLFIYPRRFRDEYGFDMAQLFADQLRDEGFARVWARTVIDLAITAPHRHLEAHMERTPNPTIPALYLAISVAGIVAAIVAGTSLGIVALGLVVAVAGAVAAVAAWRNAKSVGAPLLSSDRWWQLLVAGTTLLAVMIVVLNITGELPSGWWAPAMIALLIGFITTVFGIVLGISRLVGARAQSS